MRKHRPRYRTHAKIVSSSLVAPACRTVIVSAWHDDDPSECGHEVVPVLALRLSLVDSYYRRSGDDDDRPRVGPEHRDMVRYGWSYEDRAEQCGYLVNDEHGPMDASVLFDGVNQEWEPASCPWPQEDDEERLAGVIARVRAKAARKVAAGRKAVAP